MAISRPQKVIAILAFVWVFIFIAYTASNPDNIKVQPATQQNSGFSQLSHYATGYLNETSKTLKQTMPHIP